MIAKIKELFDKIDCPAIAILETPRAGEEVDNGMGVDFELPPYAVIHEKNFYEKEKKSFEIFYNFERENRIDITHFDKEGCTSVEDMIKELHDVDGYEVKWRRDDAVS